MKNAMKDTKEKYWIPCFALDLSQVEKLVALETVVDLWFVLMKIIIPLSQVWTVGVTNVERQNILEFMGGLLNFCPGLKKTWNKDIIVGSLKGKLIWVEFIGVN